jgi:hypothetical protein
MRIFSLTMHDVSWPGRLMIAFVAFMCLVMAAVGLIQGPLFLTATAVIFLILFLFTAPFVFAGRWRKPAPTPTRRPVYRRRRA